jgi:hypothetical protein
MTISLYYKSGLKHTGRTSFFFMESPYVRFEGLRTTLLKFKTSAMCGFADERVFCPTFEKS